jgi:hypothetical protein
MSFSLLVALFEIIEIKNQKKSSNNFKNKTGFFLLLKKLVYYFVNLFLLIKAIL